jgi:hypothetical protein
MLAFPADSFLTLLDAFSIDDMEQEVGMMLEQILAQTLPPPPVKVVDGAKKDGPDGDNHKDRVKEEDKDKAKGKAADVVGPAEK